jgi:hypothetical protein
VAAPRATVSQANHAVGYQARLVTISAITPDGKTAVCVDRQGTEVRVSMLIQPAKGILPAPGEQWVVTQDVTSAWTFTAIATSDSTVFTNPGVAGEGQLPPDILPPQPPVTPPPGSIPGSALVPGSVTGVQIAPQTITSLNLATAAAATNLIIDPQFTSAAVNSVRIADPGTICTWTLAAPSASVPGSGAGLCALALMPSTLVPLYVNPNEQYYLSVAVTLPAGTGAGISAGIQLVLNDGSFLGPLLPVTGITQTVAQLITIPAGISSCYVRLIITGLPSGIVATFTQPTLYITQGPNQLQPGSVGTPAIQAGAITANTIAAGAVTANAIAANSVSTNALQANSVTAAQIAAGSVTTGAIAAGAVTAGQIAANTITALQIAANTITAGQLAAGIVYAGIVDATTIQGATLIAGTAPNPQVKIGTSAGTGYLYVNFNQASIIDGYLQGLYSGSFAQMLLQGPRKNAAGYGDWVGLEMNSSDGSGSANAELIYNQAPPGSGQYLMFAANWNGTQLFNVSYMSAVQPGTGGSAANPPQQEGWHNLTPDVGWSLVGGYSDYRYRILPNGDLQLTGMRNTAFFSGSFAVNSSNPLPAAYRPLNAKDFRYGDAVGRRAHLSLQTNGVINATCPNGVASGTIFAEIDAIIPLNI